MALEVPRPAGWFITQEQAQAKAAGDKDKQKKGGDKDKPKQAGDKDTPKQGGDKTETGSSGGSSLGGKDPDKDKEAAKVLAGKFAKAKALRGRLDAAMSLYTEIVGSIGTKQEWAWADSDACLSPLRDAKAGCEEFKHSHPFWQTWSIQKMFAGVAKKSYDTKVINEQLARIPLLGETITKLEKECQRLVDMHNKRQEA